VIRSLFPLRLLVAGIVLWGLAAAIVELALRLAGPLPGPRIKAPKTPAAEPGVTIPERLGRSDTLSDALARNGFSARDVHELAEALAPHLNLRGLRPGDELAIHYTSEPRASEVRIERGPFAAFRAVRGGEVWRAERLPARLVQRQVARQGRIEGSLYQSMTDTGERAPLAVAFAELFAWDFDFHVGSRSGDTFAFLVEKIYRSGEVDAPEGFLGYGKLLGALYQPQGESAGHAAFYFEDSPGRAGYYDREGRSVRKAFLKSPLEFRRVSSRFSYSRLHPILGRPLPHLGVDYAAPAGTPVHAVADGVVVSLSSGGGGGKQVVLRHGMGYQSRYLHLSRFAADLRVGRRVSQKQVIGYVGATGLATAPHLDFRLTRHGRPVNPLKEIFPPGPPIAEESREAFALQVDRVLERMRGAGSRPAGWIVPRPSEVEAQRGAGR
jgi:murein DD-endopeptidase MepM/ murein hydrolase activator NlpD